MITSANTSINKNKLPRLFTTVNKYFHWGIGTLNLDLGGGKYDNATEWLAEKGVTNLIYDPFNRTEEHNQSVLATLRDSDRCYTVTISNVLNVIQHKKDRQRLMELVRLYDNHRFTYCYISIYEGDKSGIGRISMDDCWQNNQPRKFYLDELRPYFPSLMYVKYGVIVGV